MGERQPTVLLYKKEGETPLECLERFRIEQPLYEDAVLSYAGRLDPMAEGAMLVLVDEENKNRQPYLALDKSYEVEILFGVSTDTGDILGIIDKVEQKNVSEDLSSIFTSSVGKLLQKYPTYSSKTVDGKPLFQWARERKIDEIEIPEKEVEIFSVTPLAAYSLSGKEIKDQIRERISKVKGDFRQQEVLDSWGRAFQDAEALAFHIVRIMVECTSGTYMRTLATEIARKAGSPGIAWKIKRLQYIDSGVK
jgi:tRNA pseudouridine(55) synthase